MELQISQTPQLQLRKHMVFRYSHQEQPNILPSNPTDHSSSSDYAERKFCIEKFPGSVGELSIIQSITFRTDRPNRLQVALNTIDPATLARYLITIQRRSHKRIEGLPGMWTEFLVEDTMFLNPNAIDPLRDHIYEVNKHGGFQPPYHMTGPIQAQIKMASENDTMDMYTWQEGFDNLLFSRTYREEGTALVSRYFMAGTGRARELWFTSQILDRMREAHLEILNQVGFGPAQDNLREAENEIRDPHADEAEEPQELYCDSYRNEIREFVGEHYKFLIDISLNNDLARWYGNGVGPEGVNMFNGQQPPSEFLVFPPLNGNESNQTAADTVEPLPNQIRLKEIDELVEEINSVSSTFAEPSSPPEAPKSGGKKKKGKRISKQKPSLAVPVFAEKKEEVIESKEEEEEEEGAELPAPFDYYSSKSDDSEFVGSSTPEAKESQSYPSDSLEGGWIPVSTKKNRSKGKGKGKAPVPVDRVAEPRSAPVKTEENFPPLKISSPAAAPRPQPQQAVNRAKVLVALPKVPALPVVEEKARGVSSLETKEEKKEEGLVAELTTSNLASASAAAGGPLESQAMVPDTNSSLRWNDRETYPGLYPKYDRYVSRSATNGDDGESDAGSQASGDAPEDLVEVEQQAPTLSRVDAVGRRRAGSAPSELPSSGELVSLLTVHRLAKASDASYAVQADRNAVSEERNKFLRPEHRLKCRFCGETASDSVSEGEEETGDPSVCCPGCGPNSEVRYCSNACLLAHSFAHSAECGRLSGSFVLDPFSLPMRHLAARVMPRPLSGLSNAHLHRQQVYHLVARDQPCAGPYRTFFDSLLSSARRTALAGSDNWAPTSELRPGDYFLFHPYSGPNPFALGRLAADFHILEFDFSPEILPISSASTTNSTSTSAASVSAVTTSPNNPIMMIPTTLSIDVSVPVTEINTSTNTSGLSSTSTSAAAISAASQSYKHSAKSLFRRALNALFLTSHTRIATFILRMLKAYLVTPTTFAPSTSDSAYNLGQLNPTDRAPYLTILKKQFAEEFGFVAAVGERMDDVPFELGKEWAEIEELVKRFEAEHPLLRLWMGEERGAWERFLGRGEEVKLVDQGGEYQSLRIGDVTWLPEGWSL